MANLLNGTNLLNGVAYITGAGSGIGQYTAWAFARHGVRKFALTDINLKGLDTTISKLKEEYPDVETKAIEMDVANQEQVEKGIAEAVAAFGRIDFAVNNAGVGAAFLPTHEIPTSEWKKCIDINLHGVYYCQRAELVQMLKQEPVSDRQGRGTIVNTASMFGIVGPTSKFNSTAYAASKHAVMGLTKTDGVTYCKQGIRINAICPGFVETPLMMAANETSTTIRNEVYEKTALGRMATMEEIADSIVFLASPMSSFMVAQGLIVDGGYTAQ